MKTNEVIVYLYCIKYNKNYESVVQHLENKTKLTDDEKASMSEQVSAYINNCTSEIITLTDVNYPIFFRRIKRPPFVVFKKDNEYTFTDCDGSIIKVVI